MKFDLHCHTKEGSIDSKIGIIEYAYSLKKKGFQGMMVTDHDSYKGYEHWKNFSSPFKGESTLASCHSKLASILYHWAHDFTVIKGIEYDTKDAGHFLVVLPDNVHLKVLQVRGMSVNKLIKLVHKNGGVLGPAHPFGVKSSSLMFSRKIKKDPNIIKKFDFIEGFNTCEAESSNRLAKEIGLLNKLPMIGGSDSHSAKDVGQGYTIFTNPIHSNNDLIASIKNNSIIEFGGVERGKTIKTSMKMSMPLVIAFKAYNSFLGLLFSPYRNYIFKKCFS